MNCSRSMPLSVSVPSIGSSPDVGDREPAVGGRSEGVVGQRAQVDGRVDVAGRRRRS